MINEPIPTPLMRCDHTGLVCISEVRRAPVIVIPARSPFDGIYKPIRIHTPLHYCEWHRGDFKVQDYLSMAQKTRIEAGAREMRPSLFKPDFDAAFADLVLVTTPEYRRFLRYIGVVQHAAA